MINIFNFFLFVTTLSLVKAHLMDNKNKTFIHFAFYIGFLDWIWAKLSAENVNLAKTKK